MENMVRAITADGAAYAIALDSTVIVDRIEQIHRTSAVVTAALGRLATAASMMGALLKGERDTVTVRINGGGATGTLISVADSQGNVKAYVQNPVVELPLNARGKLDVAGAVGTDGTLQVIKDLGLKEPYIGRIPIASGEIAEDVTRYFAVSEQTPTACSLGVLVHPNLRVRAAGGFLVQLLPGAETRVVETIERNIGGFAPISSLVDEGVTPEQMVLRLLDGLSPEILDRRTVAYRCDCSRERVERALMSMGRAEILRLAQEDGAAEVTCHFCGKSYAFTEPELRQLAEK